MSRSEVASPAAFERYLSRLDAELVALPDSERQEILRETRSHVLERTLRSPSLTVDQVLAELGPPNEYARRFLAETDAAAATPGPGTLHRLARLAAGGLARLPLLFAVLAAYALAVLAMAIAVWKLVEPEGTGVWIRDMGGGRRAGGLVVSDPHQDGREVLGYWLVPIALGIAVSIHIAMSALLRRVLRRDARPR